MGVSKNRGTPKSSILIGFSIINHPFWCTPIFGNTHIGDEILPRYIRIIVSHEDPGYVGPTSSRGDGRMAAKGFLSPTELDSCFFFPKLPACSSQNGKVFVDLLKMGKKVVQT